MDHHLPDLYFEQKQTNTKFILVQDEGVLFHAGLFINMHSETINHPNMISQWRLYIIKSKLNFIIGRIGKGGN